MSHELEVVNGKARMFYVGETPWHDLGTPLPEAPTVENAIVAAGLDWPVNLQPLHMIIEGKTLPVPGHYATVRGTDSKVLGVVGPTFKPLQNKVAFQWFQPWLDSGQVTLETAGSLRGGRHIWVLARVVGAEVDVRKDDPVRQYILLSNGHDGTLAVRNGFTGIRVVCANTMAAAHSDKASKLLRIRHTNKTSEALEKVREVMDLARSEFAGTMDQYRALARLQVRKDDLREYVRRVFQPKIVEAVEANKNVDEKDVESAETTCERLMGRIIPLFEAGRGNGGGTVWDAYNAVSEYLSYERGRSADTRLDSLWFGEGARINQRAMGEAVKMLRMA